MSPAQWGIPTWIFLHTLAQKVKEESFPIIKNELMGYILRICNSLPCPECATHAKEFWNNVKIGNIGKKIDLINVLYVFHNAVNKRRKALPFKYIDLQYYKSQNVIETFNNFAKNFNTKGNMRLITESFYRDRLLSTFKTWIMRNLGHFNL
jgi:hypothetical protein